MSIPVLYNNNTWFNSLLGIDKKSELPTVIFSANEIKNKNKTTQKEPSHNKSKICKESDNHYKNFETRKNIDSKERTEDSDEEGECGNNAIIHNIFMYKNS